jgi:tRNA-dihydrouridine synthase
VALGRIAIARPWVFAQWGQGKAQSPESHADSALRLLDLLSHYFDPVRALRRFKRYGTYLAANFAFGNTLYNRIRNAADLNTVKNHLIDFFSDQPAQLARPNMNLLR